MEWPSFLVYRMQGTVPLSKNNKQRGLTKASVSPQLFSIPLALRIRFGFMHRAKGMLRRCVERIELQWAVPHVDDVMPRARGNENGVISVCTAHLAQIASARAHIDLRLTAFEAHKLVNVRVHLHADVAARGNAH